jgi:hypothetical protein
MELKTFLEKQEKARAGWERALEILAGQPENQVDERLKALVIHINWYEREMLGLLRQRVLAGSPLWELPTDERNAEIERQERQRSLADLLFETRASYTSLIEELSRLPDEALNSAQHFENMPEDWIPWELIASNLFEHYLEHAQEIQAILDR